MVHWRWQFGTIFTSARHWQVISGSLLAGGRGGNPTSLSSQIASLHGAQYSFAWVLFFVAFKKKIKHNEINTYRYINDNQQINKDGEWIWYNLHIQRWIRIFIGRSYLLVIITVLCSIIYQFFPPFITYMNLVSDSHCYFLHSIYFIYYVLPLWVDYVIIFEPFLVICLIIAILIISNK